MSSKKTATKEKMLKEIIEQLNTSLPGLKDYLGEKKFEKRIYKAALILVDGIKIAAAKKSAPSIKKVIPLKKKSAKTTSKN